MIPEIQPDEVKQRLAQNEKLNLIDVRELDEYEEGHIPGVTLIPLNSLPNYLETLDKSLEYIMVCRRGNRSGVATELMLELGFSNPKNMVGGMQQWTGKVETGSYI